MKKNHIAENSILYTVLGQVHPYTIYSTYNIHQHIPSLGWRFPPHSLNSEPVCLDVVATSNLFCAQAAESNRFGLFNPNPKTLNHRSFWHKIRKALIEYALSVRSPCIRVRLVVKKNKGHFDMIVLMQERIMPFRKSTFNDFSSHGEQRHLRMLKDTFQIWYNLMLICTDS